MKIPVLSEKEIIDGLYQANTSSRRRHPKILHQHGAEFNEVFNFMMIDSYMQPHLHPGAEKIEKIYLVQGKIAVLFFDDYGAITKSTLLEKEGIDMIAVPAFTWHTYVILTASAITYETMMGKYEPQTWKTFFTISPPENSVKSKEYLSLLRNKAQKHIIK